MFQSFNFIQILNHHFFKVLFHENIALIFGSIFSTVAYIFNKKVTNGIQYIQESQTKAKPTFDYIILYIKIIYCEF